MADRDSASDICQWLSDGGNKPEDWSLYISTVEAGLESQSGTSSDLLCTVCVRAIKAIPPIENKNNEAYARLLLKCAHLKSMNSCYEAEQLYASARTLVKKFAFVHIAAAEFYVQQGNTSKARKILEKAILVQAQPTDVLVGALNNLDVKKSPLSTCDDLKTSPKMTEDIKVMSSSSCENMNISKDDTYRPASLSHLQSVLSSTKKPTLRHMNSTPNCKQEDFVPFWKRSLSIAKIGQPMRVKREDVTESEAENYSSGYLSNTDLSEGYASSMGSYSVLEYRGFRKFNNTPASSSSSLSSSQFRHSRQKTDSLSLMKGIGGAERCTQEEAGKENRAAEVNKNSRSAEVDKDLGADEVYNKSSRAALISKYSLTEGNKNSRVEASKDYCIDGRDESRVNEENGYSRMKGSKNSCAERLFDSRLGNGQFHTQGYKDSRVDASGDSRVDKSSNSCGDKMRESHVVDSCVAQPSVKSCTDGCRDSCKEVVRTKTTVMDVDCSEKPSGVEVGLSKPIVSENVNQGSKAPTMECVTVNGHEYYILNVVGRGGSAKVYQVFDSKMQIRALKCVYLEGVQKVVVDGFKNEIHLLKKLQYCKSVIKMYESEYNVQENKILMVMELGQTDLATFFRSHMTNGQGIKHGMVGYYWEEMLTAVHALHNEGVIHSDLKPANFILVAGNLRLIDFGIANSVQQDKTSIFLSVPMGTLSYMSPETIMGTFDCADSSDGSPGNTKPSYKIGFRSDIWSLGCILYNMVYGRTPFQHIRNQIGKLQAITNPNHIIDFPDIPNKHLLDVLQKCLARDPKKRPSTSELLAHPYLMDSTAFSHTMKEVMMQISQASPRSMRSISQGILHQLEKGNKIDLNSLQQ